MEAPRRHRTWKDFGKCLELQVVSRWLSFFKALCKMLEGEPPSLLAYV